MIPSTERAKLISRNQARRGKESEERAEMDAAASKKTCPREEGGEIRARGDIGARNLITRPE